MGHPRSLKPKRCRHKSRGRGYVTLDGKTTYTGKWEHRSAKQSPKACKSSTR